MATSVFSLFRKVQICGTSRHERNLNMKKYKVGIIGGTGMVGQRFVTLMEDHPWFQLTVIAASPRSAVLPGHRLYSERRSVYKTIVTADYVIIFGY